MAPGSGDVLRPGAWSSLNELPAPYAFPSEDFTLTRVRSSGRVISIRVEGKPVPPRPPIFGVMVLNLLPVRAPMSWEIEGRLEDLPARWEAPPQERLTTAPRRGPIYAGTQEELRVGDRIRVKRWLRKDLRAEVIYVPFVSPYDRWLGLDRWAYRLPDGAVATAAYAPEQIPTLDDRFVLLGRVTTGPPGPAQTPELS